MKDLVESAGVMRMNERRALHRVAVVVHHDRPLALELASTVIEWAASIGASVMMTEDDAAIVRDLATRGCAPRR